MTFTFFRSLLLVTALLLPACGASQNVPTPKTPQTSQSAEIDFNSPDIYKPMKGIYTYGEGVEIFSPCGTENEYWVFPYTDEMWTTLRDAHQNMATDAYGGIFVELNGWTGPTLHPIVGGEYAADYDGYIVAEGLITTRKKNSSDCE